MGSEMCIRDRYRGLILGAEDIEGVILEAEGSSEVGEDIAGVI